MITLRYAWRSLAKSPGFVAVAMLALGTGLGLSTTMFAVMDAVVHPYVAFDHPDDLAAIDWWFGRRNPMRPVELYRYLRDHTHSFERIVPVSWGEGIQPLQRDGGAPLDIAVQRVSPAWFTLVGVRPELGRTFSQGDEENVIIVSHNLWKRLFGLRRDLAGATVTLNGKPLSVVGVLPRGAYAAAWMPLPPTVETTNSTAYVRPWVRLRAGVTREQADVELKALANQLTQRYGAVDAPFSFQLNPVVKQREELGDIHKAMVGSALAVLLIACVNLAHLMMTRGLAKRRELALRMALGASRGAIIRQMFAECVLIAAGGAALGALVAYWGADILQNRMPQEVSWVGLVRPQLSWRVFALGAAAAALSAVLFGLVPAVRVAFALNLDDPLKDDAGTTTGRVRYRYNPLVVAEVAMALVLMMGGGLLLRTVHTLERERSDTNDDTLWRGYAYMAQHGVAPLTALDHQTVASIVSRVPGVLDVAFQAYRRTRGSAVSAEQTQDSTHSISMGSYLAVSPSYHHVVGIPVLRGRAFEPGDAAGPGAAIIDALGAQRLYPGEEAVGRMIKLGSATSNARWVRIVGVARTPLEREGDARYVPQPTVWVALPDSALDAQFVIRTASPDPAVVTVVARRFRQLPGVSAWIWPWDASHRAELASRGFLAKVFVTMGGVALGLAALGLYGVLAYAVSRRMREFAVRVALGAEPRALLKMVLHDGVVMLLAGTGIGAFIALMASRMLDAVLIAVLPSDVVSLVVSEVVLVGVGLAAAAAPARRASRANPMDILRAV